MTPHAFDTPKQKALRAIKNLLYQYPDLKDELLKKENSAHRFSEGSKLKEELDKQIEEVCKKYSWIVPNKWVYPNELVYDKTSDHYFL